jgi:hypothetical protein
MQQLLHFINQGSFVHRGAKREATSNAPDGQTQTLIRTGHANLASHIVPRSADSG